MSPGKGAGLGHPASFRRAPTNLPLGDVLGLARRSIRRWLLGYALVAGLVAGAVGLYVLAAPLTHGLLHRTRAAVGPAQTLADVVVLLPFSQVRPFWLDDPAAVEAPRRSSERVCNFGEERLAALEGRAEVAAMEPARMTAALTPWGRVPVLALPEESAAWERLGAVVRGKGRAAPGEVLLPEEWLAGGTPGDRVGLEPVTSPGTPVELVVAGTFRPAGAVASAAVVLLPDREWPCPPGADSAAGGGPANGGPLDAEPPNIWLITLRPGAPAGRLVQWFDERNYWENLRLYPGPRVDAMARWTPDTGGEMAAGLLRQAYLPVAQVLALLAALVGAGILSTLLVGFLDRRREIAVLKTVGLDGRALGRVVGAEVGLVGAAGVAAGAGLALAAFSVLMPLYPPGTTAIGAGVWLRGIGLAAGTLVAAAAVPVALARAATVNQLLFNQPVRLFQERVSGRGSRARVPAGR